MRGVTLIELMVVVSIVVLLAALLVPTGMFVDEDVAVRALEAQGFTKVEVVDKAYYFIGMRGGDQSDSVRFECEAINPAGKRVTMHVFSGWLFKGATIRTLN